MSRGGSRSGAGRPAQNIRVESLHRLDVRDLQRRGLLAPGRAFDWSWTRDRRQTAAVSVSVTEAAVTLRYRWGGQGDVVGVPLYLDRTACRYGGQRPWFACPYCGHRVAIVYLASRRWGCRHCLRVRYASQSEDAIQRTWRRTRKIEARLAGGENRPHGKPAGMRWATFDRLQDELAAIEAQRSADLCTRFARLFPDLWAKRPR